MKQILLFVICAFSAQFVVAQETEKTTSLKHFSGSVLVTNNGISMVPSFSLGEPAVVFDLAMGGDKLRFEPQFRFSLEGQPWAFVFWFRYLLTESEKFDLRVGAHPALMFSDVVFEENGTVKDGIEARRFLATEIESVFKITEHFKVKPYYLFGHGLNRGLSNMHYLTIRGSISDIKVLNQLLFSLTPEVYYLWMDKIDGFYCASSFTLKHHKWPFELGTMVNKKIDTDIVSDDFLWNVSLTYSFGD